MRQIALITTGYSGDRGYSGWRAIDWEWLGGAPTRPRDGATPPQNTSPPLTLRVSSRYFPSKSTSPLPLCGSSSRIAGRFLPTHTLSGTAGQRDNGTTGQRDNETTRPLKNTVVLRRSQAFVAARYHDVPKRDEFLSEGVRCGAIPKDDWMGVYLGVHPHSDR